MDSMDLGAGAGVVGVVIAVAVLALLISYCVGMYYATKAAFHSQDQGDMRCIMLSEAQKNFFKLACIMFWIVLALSVVGALLGGGYQARRRFGSR